MADLTSEIINLLNERFVGKFLDEGPSGMQVIGFERGSSPLEESYHLYIRYKDLGWERTPNSNYTGEVKMFALGSFQVYSSLEELAKLRAEKGKKLLGYDFES